MPKSRKHFPEQTDTRSILSEVPDEEMGAFVDRLLASIPPKNPISGSNVAKRQAPEIETEEDGKRAGALRIMKLRRRAEKRRDKT